MALSTYADLKSTVAAYLNRSNLTSYIPYFVQLCETKLAYGSKEAPFQVDPLRIRAMEASSTLTVNAQSVALPTGYLDQRRLYLSGTPNIRVDYVTPEAFWDSYLSSYSGQPSQFTIEGENIIFGPTPASSYTGKLLYYQKLTALSADADTNWLLTNAFGAYLHGTLAEAYRYVRNMEQAQSEHNAFAGIVNALNSANTQDRYPGSWTAKSDTGNP